MTHDATTKATHEAHRITIEHDAYAEPPSAWDEPLELHGPGSLAPRWFLSGEIDALACGVEMAEDGATWSCGYSPSEHADHSFVPDPSDGSTCAVCETNEIWFDVHHEWEPEPEIVALVYVDSRGPYTTIERVSPERVREDPAHFEPNMYRGRGDTWLGALVKNPGVWWEELDTNPETLETVIDSVVAMWGTYFSGDVYAINVEYRTRCECCEFVNTTEEESLSGIYGQDYVREVLRGDMGLTDEEIDAAEITGNASWVIR